MPSGTGLCICGLIQSSVYFHCWHYLNRYISIQIQRESQLTSSSFWFMNTIVPLLQIHLGRRRAGLVWSSSRKLILSLRASLIVTGSGKSQALCWVSFWSALLCTETPACWADNLCGPMRDRDGLLRDRGFQSTAFLKDTKRWSNEV